MQALARTVVLSVAAASPALAQSNIDTAHKYSWSENCGWMNWRDSGAGAQGAVIAGSFMSGFVWLENAGYLNLGDGTPVNGSTYANSTGADAGVNIAAGGNLSGLAWGENIGWVNFDTLAALGASGQNARFSGGRLRGYAWGENIGWVNLDDATHYVGISCYPNCDNSTAPPILNVNDFQCFINKYAANDSYANCDNSTAPPVLNTLDFGCFLNKFAAGCP